MEGAYSNRNETSSNRTRLLKRAKVKDCKERRVIQGLMKIDLFFL